MGVDRLILATHEAAHAVIALALGCSVRRVTLDPSECEVWFHRGQGRDELVVILAGDLAITRAGLPHRSWGDDDDVRQVVQRDGLDDLALVFARARAADLIETHWSAICRVTAALLDAGEMTGSDVRRAMHAPDEGARFLVGLSLGVRATEANKGAMTR